MKNFIDITHKNLAVKLAETREEIEKARVLRFDELINKSNPNIPYSQCFDDSDFIYDHLIVIDRDNGSVVGTYRLGRREQLEKIGDFYTNVKFNVDSLMAAEGEVLELSRMAIRESYRDGSVIKLLWKGLFAYCARFDVKWLFGIISLPTTEPDDALNFLSYINNGLLTEEFDLFAREPGSKDKAAVCRRNRRIQGKKRNAPHTQSVPVDGLQIRARRALRPGLFEEHRRNDCHRLQKSQSEIYRTCHPNVTEGRI